MHATTRNRERLLPDTSPEMATSQRGTAIQLGLTHLIAAAVALGLFYVLAQRLIQPLYALLIALAAASICGLLCTLNLQCSLYLLELALTRLGHSQLRSDSNSDDGRTKYPSRWPTGTLFLRLQEIEQRFQRLTANESLTTDLREEALHQVGEAAALAERNRIARELHDSIKQQIFGISMSAAAAKALWHGENSEGAREAVEDIQRSAQEAQVEMQALLQQLRPAPLEDSSLIEALHIQAQALSFRTGAQVHLEIEGLPEDHRLLPGTQEAIFRLVQEAFANIAKHARAQTVWLTLRAEVRTLHIEIRDDGQGFDPAGARKSMGLNNLRKRAQDLHGLAEINSQPGQGTTVLISIPLLEALRSPEEEMRQRYELARFDELARHGYHLCSNASFLGMAMTMIGIIGLLSPLWNIIVLGISLVALYGYASGAYSHRRVANRADRESLESLILSRHQFRARTDLMRLACLGVLYVLRLAGLMHAALGWWLLISIFVCLIGLIQLSRTRYYREAQRHYGLLSMQELGWELERRGHDFTRSLANWCVVSVIGLIAAHSLFVLPPRTPVQESAYGIAAILVVVGTGLFFEYQQIQHWKQTLSARERHASTLEMGH